MPGLAQSAGGSIFCVQIRKKYLFNQVNQRGIYAVSISCGQPYCRGCDLSTLEVPHPHLAFPCWAPWGGREPTCCNTFRRIMASKSLKRTKLNCDSDPETVTALTPSWPHFFIMTDADSESARLKTLFPFAVSLGISSIAGVPKSVKSIKSGLLIEVRKQAHAENLLKTTTFVEVPVKITPHRSLN